MPAPWRPGARSSSTIRSRIQWLVVACVLPVLLLALALIAQSHRDGRAALERSNERAARDLAQAVDEEIDALVRVLQTLSISPAIEDGDYRRFHEQARAVLHLAGADNVVLLDPQLQLLVSAAHPLGTPLPRFTGRWFEQRRSDSAPMVSDLVVGQMVRQPMVAVAVPVLREGRAIAYLGASLGVRHFADLLVRRALPSSWLVVLMDSRGTLVARQPADPKLIGQPGGARILARIAANEREGTYDGNRADGQAVAVSFSRGGRHRWVAVIGVPQSELLARLWQPLWWTLAAAAVLLGAGLMLARALGRRIVEPVQALVAPALAIGRGEVATVPPSSLREMSELGQALQQAQELLQSREQERQQALSSLRASQTRLQVALEAAAIGDWDLDLASGAARHSLQHDRCFGYEEPIVDWHMERFLSAIHPEDQGRVRASVQETLRTHEPWRDEFRILWPDGSTHWVSSHCQFLDDPHGPGHIVGVVIDITSHRQAEELRLQSVQLQAENRQIQEANRLKSEFLANMSHELRTPLNAVIGFADVLRSGGEFTPAKRDQFLGHIATSGRHLLRLINDVLDLTKVESGKFELALEPLHLEPLAAEVVAVLQTEATRQGLQVELQIDPALGELLLDPARVKQMLYNLLSNAIKFSGRGTRVLLRACAEDGQSLRIEVQDWGIGIAAQDMARLFRPFEQVHTGPAKAYAGTGLGLALTRQLAELHGGQVGVHSTPGQGSVFHIVLPRRARPAQAPQRPRETLPPRPEPTPAPAPAPTPAPEPAPAPGARALAPQGPP